jgi:hypothetical protein
MRYEVLLAVIVKTTVLWHVIISIYLNCKWVSGLWQWYYNKTQLTNAQSPKITPHFRTKHSIQSYTDQKGHITHNEYSVKKKVKLSL